MNTPTSIASTFDRRAGMKWLVIASMALLIPTLASAATWTNGGGKLNAKFPGTVDGTSPSVSVGGNGANFLAGDIWFKTVVIVDRAGEPHTLEEGVDYELEGNGTKEVTIKWTGILPPDNKHTIIVEGEASQGNYSSGDIYFKHN